MRSRIAVLIDTATSWGTGLIEGIVEYAREIDRWQIFMGPRGKFEAVLVPPHWQCDGVIARVTRPELAEDLIARQISAVNVSWYQFGKGRIPQCTCDPAAVAEMAASHFLERGFRQFAYCASSLRPGFEDQLGAAFVQCVKRRSYKCENFSPRVDAESLFPSAADQELMVHWLRSLPKPVGLLAFDSLQARQVAEACHVADIEIPNEIALLGGEYDQLSCLISEPELSSVDHSPRKVGYAAAGLLDRMMAGEAVDSIIRPPARVITRQSTDTLAVRDDLLALAMRFIKTHSHEKIQITDILRAVPISRRALEKGFRKQLGRSPAEEIRRVRVDRAAQLLCDTSWSMPRIAGICGFDRPELLARAFRRELNMTPTQFRRQHLASRQSLERAD